MRVNRKSKYTNSKLDKDHLKFGLPSQEKGSNSLRFNRKIFFQVLFLIGISTFLWLLNLSPETKVGIS